MLTADQIRDMLRCLPDAAAVSILAELSDRGDRVYEATRIAHEHLGAERGDELIASMVRGTVAR